MQAFEIAHVAHQTPRRLRLRIPARRNDAPFFAWLERELLARPGVAQVECSPLAASVAITGERALDWSSLRLTGLGLALVESGPSAALASPHEDRQADGARGGLRRVSNADFDLAGVMVQVAAIGIARQPIVALLQWLAEALLRALLRELFTAEVEDRQLALPAP
jgi:hypothetical protein